MSQLNYRVLKNSGYQGYILNPGAPVKVLQFGEGNFLRAFVDYWFDMANERSGYNGKVAVVQPIAQGLTEQMNRQEGLYTLYLRGSERGKKVDRKRVISAIDACYNPCNTEDWVKIKAIACSDDLEYIASNTTEAGIVRKAVEVLESDKRDSSLRKLDSLTAKDVYDAAKAGDELALEIADFVGRMLGTACARISTVIDPEIYVIGGGVSKAGDILIESIKKQFVAEAFHVSEEARFALATLGVMMLACTDLSRRFSEEI